MYLAHKKWDWINIKTNTNYEFNPPMHSGDIDLYEFQYKALTFFPAENTDTFANNVDPDETARRLIRIYIVCHSAIDFLLNPFLQ